MDNTISKIRQKRAKKRIGQVNGAVAGDNEAEGARHVAPLLIHIAGYIVAAAISAAPVLCCGEPSGYRTVAGLCALALLWFVARPAFLLAARDKERTLRTAILEQLLVIAPAAFSLAFAALVSGWSPLKDFLRQIPFFNGLDGASARLILLESSPVTFSVLIAVLLYGRGTCAIIGAMSGMMLSIMSGFSLAPLAMALAATMVFLRRGRRISSRSKARRLAFQATVALFAVSLVFLAAIDTAGSRAEFLDLVATRLVSAVASAQIGAMLALAVLPAAERFSNLYSNIAINAFADLDHPLLKELRYGASGTFAHSDRVSLLASAAAEAIGANVILARVAGYYHDIGKLAKPEYFTENFAGGPNPHDSLSPYMSRMIIANHVKDGVVDGRKHHLPPPIIDAIAQHHGNSLIRAFYGKAIHQNSAQAELPGIAAAAQVDANQFRYDSKKPATREVAILMLADIVEAALRSMPGITTDDVPSKIDMLVKSVVDDGQLDDCPLSFRELCEVKKALALTYIGMSHTRVAYPAIETPPKDGDGAAKPAPPPAKPKDQ